MGGYRDHFLSKIFIGSKDYLVNFESKKYKRRSPTQLYFERLNNVFKKIKQEFETEDGAPPNSIQNYPNELEEQGIFTTSTSELLEIFDSEKNQSHNDNEINTHEQNRFYDKRHYEESLKIQDNIEQVDVKKTHVHEIANALSITDPTIYSELLMELPNLIKRNIPNHQRNQIIPKIEKFIEMYKRMEEQGWDLNLEDITDLWNDIDQAIISAIPAFVHDSLEGIIININSAEEQYEILKQENPFLSLKFIEYLEYLLLHELFHVVVTRRALENDLLNEYIQYVKWGRASYPHLAEVGYPTLENFSTSDYIDANNKNTVVLNNAIVDKVELTESIKACVGVYKPGYYFPLEEALANHFAYIQHSRYLSDKNNPFPFLILTDSQGVGYQDWHTFHSLGEESIHAAYVELGWMIKGKQIENGVNIAHDLIINSSASLPPPLQLIIGNYHSKQKSIFKNTRTLLKTIQKETPVHLIIDDQVDYFATQADINKIKTYLKRRR